MRANESTPEYWEPALTDDEAGRHGCVHAGPRARTFSPEWRIGVGFGCAMLTRDGHPIWRESPGMEWEGLMTGAEAEARAAADPDHDWRIVLFAPLSESEYQRQGAGNWVLIRKGRGFA